MCETMAPQTAFKRADQSMSARPSGLPQCPSEQSQAQRSSSRRRLDRTKSRRRTRPGIKQRRGRGERGEATLPRTERPAHDACFHGLTCRRYGMPDAGRSTKSDSSVPKVAVAETEQRTNGGGGKGGGDYDRIADNRSNHARLANTIHQPTQHVWNIKMLH